MAEDQDDSQRTEEPTSRKLAQAREHGQVVSSQEIKHGFMLLGALIVVLALAPMAARDLTLGMAAHLEALDQVPTDGAALIESLRGAVLRLTMILILPLGALVVTAVAATLIQHGWLVSADSIQPKLSKISPLAGAKRLFSMRSVVELLKGIAKVAVVGVIVATVIEPELDSLQSWAGLPMGPLIERIWQLAVQLLGTVLAAVVVLAGLDYLYQRFAFLKQQRMTKQEIKDEYKNTEGDPVIKGRMRQLRMERARRRMIAAVPTADVVITNPTHVAVAMKYDPATMAAPVVVAKGLDHLALKIRSLAEEHKVMIMENPPLARALHQAVEVDQPIPPEFYKAVAEIISYVFKLRQRSMPAA